MRPGWSKPLLHCSGLKQLTNFISVSKKRAEIQKSNKLEYIVKQSRSIMKQPRSIKEISKLYPRLVPIVEMIQMEITNETLYEVFTSGIDSVYNTTINRIYRTHTEMIKNYLKDSAKECNVKLEKLIQSLVENNMEISEFTDIMKDVANFCNIGPTKIYIEFGITKSIIKRVAALLFSKKLN